jgi:hypothetical protein
VIVIVAGLTEKFVIAAVITGACVAARAGVAGKAINRLAYKQYDKKQDRRL